MFAIIALIPSCYINEKKRGRELLPSENHRGLNVFSIFFSVPAFRANYKKTLDMFTRNISRVILVYFISRRLGSPVQSYLKAYLTDYCANTAVCRDFIFLIVIGIKLILLGR